jgi:hypothetical protein
MALQSKSPLDFKRFTRGECPICSGSAWGCGYGMDGDDVAVVFCIDKAASHNDYVYRGESKGEGYNTSAMWVPNERAKGAKAAAETVEEKLERARRRQEQLQAIEERNAGNPNGNLRHQEYSKLIAALPSQLHPIDAADLARRGISPDRAKAMGIRSIGAFQPLPIQINASIPGIGSDGRSMKNAYAGYIVPIRDTSGRILGAQLKNRATAPQDGSAFSKYLWLSSSGKNSNGYGPSLACGDLPLAFYAPATPDLDRADYLGFCEGTGVKVALIADRFGVPTIGGSGGSWGKAGNDFYLLDQYYKASGKKHLMLFPDAGAIFNPDVIGNYAKLAEFVAWKNRQGETAVQVQKAIGDKKVAKYQPIELKVMWWDQFTKQSPDPDELTNERSIVLSWKQFFSCTLGTERKPAQAWIDSRKFTPDEVRDSRYCDFPAPQHREMLCIKASLGLGKTERMIRLIVELGWAAIVLDPTNNLCINFNERAAQAGIDAEMVGQLTGMGEAIAAAGQCIQIISLCPDSILAIDIESASQKILVIDEANETGLAFRQRPTHIKKIRREAIEHLTGLLHVVHSVVVMDGNLSDLSCQWFLDLCPSLKARKIEYSHKNKIAFDLEIGTKDEFISNMVYRLKQDDTTIIVGTDSKADTRAAQYALNADTAKECAVDEDGNLYSEWAELLMKDPAEFVRLFSPTSIAYSPAAGSGWNCNVGDYFKENFILGLGVLGVDGMLQMSARDRNLATTRRTWIAPIGLQDCWKIDKESCLPEDILEAYSRNQAEYDSLMGRPNDRAWKIRALAIQDFIRNDTTARLVMAQAAFSNFEQFHLRGCFLWAIVTGGNKVSLVLPVSDDDRIEAGKEHKALKKLEKRTFAQKEIEADLIDNKKADIFKNAARITAVQRAQIARNSLERILPGIASKPIFSDTTPDEEKGTIANQEFVIKAPKIAARATAFYFFAHPNIAQRKAQNKYQAQINNQWIDLTSIDIQYTFTTKFRKTLLKNVPALSDFSSGDDGTETLSYSLFPAASNSPSFLINKEIQASIVKDLRGVRKLEGRSHQHFLSVELRKVGFDVKILKKFKDLKGVDNAAIGDLWVTVPYLVEGSIEQQCYECVCDRFMPKSDEPEEMQWELAGGSIVPSESLALMDEFKAASDGFEAVIAEDGYEYSIEYDFKFDDEDF